MGKLNNYDGVEVEKIFSVNAFLNVQFMHDVLAPVKLLSIEAQCVVPCKSPITLYILSNFSIST